MARVSFVLRRDTSASGSYVRYPDGGAGSLPARTDNDSFLRADGLQVAATAIGTSTFAATVVTYKSVTLDWSVPLSATAGATPTPTSLVIVYSKSGVPHTVASGKALVNTTSGISTFIHDDSSTGESLTAGEWVYYSMFVNYTSTGGDNFYTKVADLEVLIPVDYGSALTLWNQLPKFVRMQDIALGDYNYSADIGTTHGDKVGPLFKYLSIIGFDMDCMRTLIDYVMVSKDPTTANGETLDALADMMGIALRGSELGEARLRGILDNIGVYQRSKGTPAAIKQMIGGITGSNVTYSDSTRQYSIQSQRANYITVPKTGTGLTTWRESYPGESTAGTALNLLRGAEFFIDAGRAVNAEQAALNQGTGGSALNARYGTGSSVDASDPLLLTHTGTNHLYLPGVAGNTAIIPDNPSLALTGNIEVVMRLSLTDWTPTTSQYLIAKWSNSAKFAWSIYVNATTGQPVFAWSPDGTSGSVLSTGVNPSTALPDGVTVWIRAKFNISNRQLSFEWAADSPTEPTSWGTAALGTSGAATTIAATAAPLEIGSTDSGGGSNLLNGKVYRAIIRNGFAGPTVVDVDFTTGLTSGNQVSVPFTGTALATSTPQYVSNLGTGGRALVAKVGSAGTPDTNDPMLLTHTGENYMYSAGGAGGNASVSNNFAKIPDNGGAMDLIGTPGITYLSLPGIVGHYASTPSNAALQIAGDIDVVFGCSFNTLTPASSVGLFGRDGADPNRVWALTLTTTGALSFRWYPTGSLASQIITTSTVTLPSVGITAGQRVNLRVTLDVDNLSSSNEVKFYYSTDFGATYTQLGATVTTAGVTSLSTTTSAALTINPDLGGTPFAGKVYIAVVRSGIGGTNVFISNFTTAIMGSSTFVDGGQVAANGMLVTLTGSLAKFVDGTTFFSQALPNDYTAVAGSFLSYCTVPDNAAFTPTTSISYRFAVAANNWIPDRDAYLGGHYIGTTNNRSSLCRIGSGAVCRPAMLLSPDGTGTNITTDGASVGLASVNATTTVAAALGSMTNGSPYVIRYDYVTTGTSASVSFFAKTTSASAGNADALSDTGWTAVGTPVTTNVPYVLFNPTATMSIGGLAGNPPVAGRHYAAVVKVDGVTQVNIDFTQQALYATSFTETSTNLSTVTVTGGSNNDARIDRVRDIELVCRLALDDWTCATSFSSQNLISKGYGTDYLWFVTSTNVQFYGTIGAATGNFFNLPWPLASRPANGVTIWMKVTRNSTTGEIVLYTAPDSVTEPSSWTTVTTNTNIIGNFKGNTGHPTAIGGAVQTSSTQSSLPATGKFYRAIVRNGIGGPAVVDVDFTKSITSGAQTSVLTGGTAAQYATNLSTVSGASVMTARSGTLPASDGADPVLLPWTGTNYVWFDSGAAGAAPNRLAISTTVVTPTMLVGSGTLEWRCKAFVDGTTAELMGTSNTFLFGLYVAGSNLTLGLTIAGVNYFMNLGAVPVGRVVTYRATFDPVSGNVIGYYSLDDGATWVTLNTIVHAGAVSVFGGSVYLGAISFGIGGSCRIYTAELITAGTRTLYFNSAVDITSGDQASGTVTSGQTFTIQRHTSGRKTATVVRPTWIFGSADFMEVQDNALLDVTVAENLTVVAIVRQWGTPTNYGRYISKKNGNPAAGWELLTSSTTTGVFLEIADGTNTAAAPVVTPTTGALAMVGAQINRSSNTLRNFVNTTFSTTVSTTALTGTLANGFPMRIGKRADYSGNQEFELVAVAVFKSVVSDANLATIYNYYINGGADATSILQTANFWIDAALSPPALAITRSTSDHKSVAVVRPTFLFGGNDYMEVIDNDLLDFGANDSFTVVAAVRQWATPLAGGRYLSKAQSGTINGYHLVSNGATFTPLVAVGDGVTSAQLVGPTLVEGAMSVFGSIIDRAAQTIRGFANTALGATASTSAVGTAVNNYPLRIGSRGDAAGSYQDFEFFGAAVFRKALTATEIALINTHYQGEETTESIALLSTAVLWISASRSQQEMAINRSTTGKKAVAVTRPTWLLNSTYMELPDNDLIDFGSSQDFTMLVVTRVWNTPASYSYYMQKQVANLPTGNKGYDIRNNVWPSVGGAIGDGTGSNNFNTFPLATATANPSSLMTLGMQRTGTSTKSFYNNTFGTPITNSYDMSNSSVLRIAGSLDAELLAVAIFRRALTATEIAAINTYYGTV